MSGAEPPARVDREIAFVGPVAAGGLQARRALAREPFDPAPQRERLRGVIAVVLVGLFALAILPCLAIFWTLPDRASDLKDLLPLVLTPLTSVVSAVLGFHCGAQARRDD